MTVEQKDLSIFIQQPTGLPNASGYMQMVAELGSRRKYSEYCAFYFNVKGFGGINREIGREQGDELIRSYAENVQKFLKEDELLGHLGGDNFMAFLLRAREQEFIRYLSAVPVDTEIDGHKKRFLLAATVGVWEITEDSIDIGDVISRPSIALNHAKNFRHQDVVMVSDDMVEKIRQRKTVLADFHDALERQEFVVYYQPKVDSRDNGLVGAEGLVRWIHEGKMVSPGIFIPPLEENGDIVLLDYYVLNRVCQDMRTWISKGIEPVTVSVNFSRKDLDDEHLAENINAIIEKAGIDKDLIQVEVTETIDEREHSVLTEFIDKLFEFGITTAIDDFGSGYSALSTLREFRIHTLKIDRSFIDTDVFSWRDRIILQDIVHMARELGMDVITEGVERDDQLDFVNQAGCYVIQGFYYDRPLAFEEFEKRLVEGRYDGRKNVFPAKTEYKIKS